MSLTPTPEQQAIIEAACTTQDNLLISALAGAAKTSTLEMICRALPSHIPILSLAFNKRIAEEMTKRLPGHVKCQTLNALGHRVWAGTVTGRLTVNTDKTYNLFKAEIEGLPKKYQSEAWDVYSELRKILTGAKMGGYIPDGIAPHAQRLISYQDFWQAIEDSGVYSEEALDFTDLIDRVLTESITQAYHGHIDFDDQIYMPTLFGGTFPRFPLVMVDEAQDLSLLNHTMLGKLVTQRVMAVGDPYQSIYGFRGAYSNSMAALQARFGMRELGLSVSFRCPIEVVKYARRRAPHMQWPEWAKPGQIVIKEEWSASDIPDSAAIICRNNAPLFRLAFALIRAGRGVTIVGADIGPGLIKTLKKLGPETLDHDQAILAIDEWEKERLKRTKAKAAIHDKAECLRVFVAIGQSLAGAIAYAESIFKSKGPIQLLSGHKSKGLEWDSVFHLDPWRVPSKWANTDEELEQERNLEYVIATRAKDTLTFINMDDFQP